MLSMQRLRVFLMAIVSEPIESHRPKLLESCPRVPLLMLPDSRTFTFTKVMGCRRPQGNKMKVKKVTNQRVM